MAEPIVSFLVEVCADLLLQEAKLLYGVGDHVKRLREELQRMRCFLRDADSKQYGDARVRNCVAEIRDLAYDAEDVLDTVALKLASKRSSGRIKNVLKRFANFRKVTTLHIVGSKIEEIMRRISEFTRSLQTYGVKELKEAENSGTFNSTRRQLRRTYSHVVDHNVVGLDEGVKILVAQLENKESRVVSICGMGGSGKTTLAKKVYHHPQLIDRFDHFIWAYVSQECQTRDIWEEILFKIISPDEEKRKEIGEMKDTEIAKMVYKLLQEKRCLVVLDDIWSVSTWQCLSPGFPSQDTDSKILLTSRNKDVAHHADPRGFLYEPPSLNDKESWELFQKIVKFENSCAGMKELGQDMVRHCKGLPLAIVVLGGLLTTKKTFDEWDRLHENIKSHLKRGQGDDEQQLGIYDVLAMSYENLPCRLRPCFLYLGQFPEDFEIPIRRLINLWVAEDLIPLASNDEDEETSEDVAYRYLNELIERYMVQVEKKSQSGRIKSCRMHDHMRELCLSKVRENNFFQILRLQNSNRQMDFFSSFMVNRPTSIGKIRRLSIHLNNFSGSVPLEYEECPPIRSLLGFRIDRHSGINQELIESMVSGFKLLRVFDLEDIRGFEIPRGIGNLIHLRLFTLNSVWIGNLSSIGNLRFLLALNLEDLGHSARKIPNVIWKMKQLRHLYLPVDCGSKTKRLQLQNLSNLQTLKNFPAAKAKVEDLITLANLRKLGIIIPDVSSLSRFMAIFKPPTAFNHLRSLSIKWEGALKSTDVKQIVSCCPRLSKLKQNHEIIYQKTSNFF